jgi:DNA topoisomerase IB
MENKKNYIKRLKKNKKFIYTDQNNKPINDKKTLDKISKIYIAPAYTDVKIFLNSKVLAIGTDDAGRKQYVYSDKSKSDREKKKYKKLLAMCNIISRLKNKINKDLESKEFDHNKLVALTIKIMDICNFRGGNKKYEEMYGSHGISTLHKKHIQFKKDGIEINFIGKKGVDNYCLIKDKKINGIIKKLYKLSSSSDPYLFSIKDPETKKKTRVSVIDMNKYLEDYNITTKDLRTWNANIIFLKNLKKHAKNMWSLSQAPSACSKSSGSASWKSPTGSRCNYDKSEEKTDVQKLKLRKKIIRESLESTAQLLHHTPAVCKSSYIYKNMITCLEEDENMFNNLNYKSEELLKKMLDRGK